MFGENFVMLMGRVAFDGKSRQAGSGRVSSFRIASSENVKKKNGEVFKKTVFVDCETWGPQGDFVATLRKGQWVIVTGKLAQEEWEKDGVKRSKHKVEIETVRRLTGPLDQNTEAQVDAGSESEGDDLPF